MTKYDKRRGSILRVYRTLGPLPAPRHGQGPGPRPGTGHDKAGICLCALAAVLLLSGCGGARLVASDRAGISGSVPAWAVVGYRTDRGGQTAIDPETGEALSIAHAVWSFDEGTGAERQPGAGRWTVRSIESDLESGEATTRAVSGHVVGPYGTVYLAWSRSIKDTDPNGPPRLFVFEPPLIWFPASIEPREVFEHKTRLTERHPKDEERVALSGTAIRRVAIVDETSPGWPFGERTGRAVAAELRIRVGPAEAVRRRTIMLGADGNAGDEFVDYGIRVLGVPLKRERTLYRTSE